MDVKTYIQGQLSNVHHQIEDVMKDTTVEQFNWSPPGTINPMNAILIHALSGEDFFVQTIIQGKPRYWEVQEWARKIGIQSPPRPGGSWDEFRSMRILVDPVMVYEQAVCAATDFYLDGLTTEELDRPVKFFDGLRPVAEILMITVGHLCFHAGEMSVIKEMQGIKG
jgi:DinB superfamily